MRYMLFNPKKSGASIKWKYAVGRGGGTFPPFFARPVSFLGDVKWKEHARYWTCDQDNIKTKTKRLRVHRIWSVKKNYLVPIWYRILKSVTIKYLENFHSYT